MAKWLAILLVYGVTAGAAAADLKCKPDGAGAPSGSAVEPYVRGEFAAGRYDCGIDQLRIEALARSPIEGIQGWDSRFALREFSLDVGLNKAYPVDKRLGIFQATAAPSLDSTVPRTAEDLVADSRMALEASLKVEDCSAQFSLLSVAALVNRRLSVSDRDREVANQQIFLCESRRASDGYRDLYRGIDALLQLEKDTRGDPGLASWRSSLARDVDFAEIPDPVDRQLVHVQQVLQLEDGLKDVGTCPDCGSDWRWRPLFHVAVFYHRRQLLQESAETLKEALDLVRSIPDPSRKLRAFHDICFGMQLARFSDDEYLPVIREMKPLAASVHTEEAAAIQKRLETDNCVPAGSPVQR